MNDNDRAKLIEALEKKTDHDVLILAAADVVELKENFKTVCVDVKDHGTRITVLETNWKIFGILAGLAMLALAAAEILLR